MADEKLEKIEFEVSRIQAIGKSMCVLAEKHKASSFEMMLALSGEICRKYHRDKTNDEMIEIFSRLTPDKEVANG